MFKRRDIPPVLLLLLLIILVMLTLSQILVVHNGRYGRNVHNMRKLQLELREMDINLHSLMMQNVPSIELSRRMLQNEINAGRIKAILAQASRIDRRTIRTRKTRRTKTRTKPGQASWRTLQQHQNTFVNNPQQQNQQQPFVNSTHQQQQQQQQQQQPFVNNTQTIHRKHVFVENVSDVNSHPSSVLHTVVSIANGELVAPLSSSHPVSNGTTRQGSSIHKSKVSSGVATSHHVSPHTKLLQQIQQQYQDSRELTLPSTQRSKLHYCPSVPPNLSKYKYTIITNITFQEISMT